MTKLVFVFFIYFFASGAQAAQILRYYFPNGQILELDSQEWRYGVPDKNLKVQSVFFQSKSIKNLRLYPDFKNVDAREKLESFCEKEARAIKATANLQKNECVVSQSIGEQQTLLKIASPHQQWINMFVVSFQKKEATQAQRLVSGVRLK